MSTDNAIPVPPASTAAPVTANLPAVVPPAAPPAPPKASPPSVSFDADDPVALYMSTGPFEQLQRVARMMTRANLVPAHLRSTKDEDKTADCFLVAAQAFRWRMDPFSVAQHTFVTSGKLGYEGKLIAGLINASGKLVTNLEPRYSGPIGQPARKVEIVGRIKGEDKDRVIDGTVAQWKTANEKWTSMPDQMLFYRGAREWARRHMPEVMLGISAEEEVVEMERDPKGTFIAAPSKLGELTERLRAPVVDVQKEPCSHPKVTADVLRAVPVDATWGCPDCGEEIPGAKPAAPCSHPEIPPSRVAALPAGKSIVCSACGEELSNPAAAREPGADDDDPAPTAAATTKPTAVPGKGRQRTLEE